MRIRGMGLWKRFSDSDLFIYIAAIAVAGCALLAWNWYSTKKGREFLAEQKAQAIKEAEAMEWWCFEGPRGGRCFRGRDGCQYREDSADVLEAKNLKPCSRREEVYCVSHKESGKSYVRCYPDLETCKVTREQILASRYYGESQYSDCELTH